MRQLLLAALLALVMSVYACTVKFETGNKTVNSVGDIVLRKGDLRAKTICVDGIRYFLAVERGGFYFIAAAKINPETMLPERCVTS